ncbi:MAG: NAD(P)/FAD-dependent oxidoreductase [Sarcina sp.]
MKKVIVIGAGPAGIMAALTASKNNEVILIEKNNEIGKKLRLTGGGRCNITNNRDIEEFFDKVVTNNKFLYSAFYSFSNLNLLEYFKNHQLDYKVEYDQKVFTKSDKADEVIDLFYRDLRANNVKLIFNKSVLDFIIKENKIEAVILSDGTEIKGDKVILATGGKSFPNTGSDGNMYSILEKYGHSIIQPKAALIPLVIKEDFIKNLQGVAMKEVLVKVKIGKKKIEKTGDMIFTHFGVSGPAILKISSYLNKELIKGEIQINIDFLNEFSKEEISKLIRSNSNKSILNNLKGTLPQNFLKEILNLLNLQDVKVSELKKEDENKLIELIKNMTLTVRETLTIKAAQVTSGGVKVKEINASSMESKIIKDLFFAGETIDVDAETGGYNLQIAFSTGYLAALDY